MLGNQFDPGKLYRYVRYGRMSDPKQNPTSPDQQFNTIARTLQRCKYDHWIHHDDYRDDGVSGRTIRKRIGLQKMLRDVKSGAIVIDLILVDDIDRFGRMAELPQIRRDLYTKHGVMILDAKSNFVDPQGTQGRIYSVFEELRANEEGRTKAHRVMRGKRDAIQQRRWPGGPPPFGFRLEHRFEERNGRSTPYAVIVPDSESDWIVRLAFRLADKHGWGQGLVAKSLNEDPSIPDLFKPFEAATVGSWFVNEIFTGTIVWPKVTTDLIGDNRVIERVPPEEQLRIDDYCPSIVERELFERVHRVRTLRGQAMKVARNRKDTEPEKLILAPVPGLTLKYSLTGLVRCGHCGRSMVPSGSAPYVTKEGQERRYVGYTCPGYISGNCPNGKRIPEEWLRQVVVDKIRERLFPTD